MGNVMEYLKWRGDLNFQERPFGEVDNLALSMLSYADLSGIVPEHGKIAFGQAAAMYCERKDQENAYRREECKELFSRMGDARRFRDVFLSDYRDTLNDATQFSAVQFHLDDGTKYIAFRGTDDSIAGWREDFAISFQVTPAQEQAVYYLEECMSEEGCIYRIGGHSKGGNLAVYASMMCSNGKKKNILEIYNNDGPGICPEMLPAERFGEIKDRIIRYVPEFSIVGRLFELDVTTYMVGSQADGLMQHDGLTWEVEGDRFVRRTKIPEKCEAYNKMIDTWIESASAEQRESFTRDFFDALGAGGAKRIGEIQEDGLDGYGTILIALAESESRTKVVMGKLAGAALESMRHIDLKEVLNSRQVIEGVLWLIAGILFIMFPDIAIQGIGGAAALAGLLWSGRKIMDIALNGAQEKERKRRRLFLYMAAMCLMVVLLCNYQAVMISVNLAIGILLLVFAFSSAKRLFMGKERKKAARLSRLAAGILCFMLGMASIMTPARVLTEKILAVGVFFIFYGIGKILMEMFREGRRQ